MKSLNKKNEDHVEVLFEKTNNKKNVSFLEKFVNFFNISKNSKAIDKNKLKTKPPTIPLTPLQEKFNQFISVNKYDVLIKMLENGYEMNEKQADVIHKYISNLVKNDYRLEKIENAYQIESFLKVGVVLNQSLFQKMVNHWFIYDTHKNNSGYDFLKIENQDLSERYNKKELKEFFTNKNLDNTRLEILTSELKNYILDNNIPLICLNDILSPVEIVPHIKSIKDELVLNEDSMNQLIKLLSSKNAKEIVSLLHFDDFVTIMTHCKKINKEDIIIKEDKDNTEDMYDEYEYDDDYDYDDDYELKKSARKLYNQLFKFFHYYEDNINEILNDVKEEYSGKYIERMTQLAIHNTAIKKNLKDLPEAANILLNEINIIYKHINKSESETKLHNDSNNIMNLFEKRIPEILQKYLSIDESYRLILKNTEGKNAEQLMLESLENIKIGFTNKLQEVNNEKLLDLSITNRYTKNFK